MHCVERPVGRRRHSSRRLARARRNHATRRPHRLGAGGFLLVPTEAFRLQAREALRLPPDSAAGVTAGVGLDAGQSGFFCALVVVAHVRQCRTLRVLEFVGVCEGRLAVTALPGCQELPVLFARPALMVGLSEAPRAEDVAGGAARRTSPGRV